MVSATRGNHGNHGNHGQGMGWAPHLDHVVQVSDDEVAAAMHALFTDTHNVAEGAGAAPLAAALQERAALRGQQVGLALTGGNVDAAVFAHTLRAG